jgi:BlaI family penicillinase repressor
MPRFPVLLFSRCPVPLLSRSFAGQPAVFFQLAPCEKLCQKFGFWGLTAGPQMLKIWLLGGKAWNSKDRERVQMDEQSQLSRRERQIMSIVYAQGEASAVEVWEALPDRPSRTAVRTLLRILEEKGRLRHRKLGRQFVYRPTRPRGRAGRSALQGVLTTFFDGSLEKAVAAHLSDPTAKPSPEELERLARLIREARKREKETP